MRVKIYSNEHTAWWKENYFGYTNNESEAGIFEIEEVNKKYPYIDFDTTKEDYLVKFEGLTYEELEKENQDLKKLVESLHKEQIIQAERIFDLEIENEKLKEDKKVLIKNADCCMWKDCINITKENEKLKKAIELLNLKITNDGFITVEDYYGKEILICDEDMSQYKDLKEVIECQKD